MPSTKKARRQRVEKVPFTGDPNMIIGKGLYYGLKDQKDANMVVFGATGTKKTFGVVKPNILQLNSSFVVTDPKGEIFTDTAKPLLEAGYVVKIVSTSSMINSYVYNPFDYVYDEDGEIDETRVSTMIEMFMKNATEMQKSNGDKFWDQSCRALLKMCSMYLLEFCPEERRNMFNMLRLIQKGKTDENKPSAKTDLDREFDAARNINPEAHCFSSYDTFHLAPARTANSILISAAVDLDKFNETSVRNMTTTAYKIKKRSAYTGYIDTYERDKNGKLIRTDENVNLYTIGDEKTAIFINIPAANGTYNFLVSMMYAQLFDILYGRAERVYPKKKIIVDKNGEVLLSLLDSKEEALKVIELYKNASVVPGKMNQKEAFFIENEDADEKYCLTGFRKGIMRRVYSKEVGEKFIKRFEGAKVIDGGIKMPVRVQCYLDEFANIGTIPEFPQKLATMRGYNISCVIILQSLAQLKNKYEKLYEDILSNCSTTVFLGSPDPGTCEYISKRLGKQTIRVRNNSFNNGRGKSSTVTFSTDTRDLMSPDEVARKDNDYAIILGTGEQPFLIKKYNGTDHPLWFQSGGGNADCKITPASYMKCTDKTLSSDGEAFRAAKQIRASISGVMSNGKVMSNKVKVSTNASELTKNIGLKENSAKDIVQHTEIHVSEPDEDMIMDVDSGDILFTTGPENSHASNVAKRKK